MADIWSGIGVDISGSKSSEGEWLYRSKGEMRGPVPLKVVAQKLISGEIDLKAEVAKEGGEFHSITRVAAFATHITEAKKQAKKRAIAKRGKLIAIIALLVIGVVGVAGHFIYGELRKTQAEREAQHKAAAEALAKRRAANDAVPEMGLVALVSLGTEDSVKIRSAQPGGATAKPKTKTKHGGEEAVGKPEPEEMVMQCQLSQADIFGTLKKNLGKINVCVEDEKTRDTQGLLPPTLELDFVVQTSGKVAEFSIGDRHYRTGPLNNCMIKAFNSIAFPTSKGANCPVTIPIKIGK